MGAEEKVDHLISLFSDALKLATVLTLIRDVEPSRYSSVVNSTIRKVLAGTNNPHNLSDAVLAMHYTAVYRTLNHIRRCRSRYIDYLNKVPDVNDTALDDTLIRYLKGL